MVKPTLFPFILLDQLNVHDRFKNRNLLFNTPGIHFSENNLLKQMGKNHQGQTKSKPR